MNKIIVNNKNIELIETDDLIEVSLSNKLEIFEVQKLKIKVLKNTELIVIYDNQTESKMDIEYTICDSAIFKVTEIRRELESKIQYKYYLGENSELNILKFYDVKQIKELNIIHLNGRFAKINYLFKTIANGEQKYNLVVYHNACETESDIVNHGVSLDGSIGFDVTSVVYQGIKGCTLNQTNKIITFNESKSVINPNLLIEENDVIANHSALIGSFSDEEIFYLMSRGISKEDSINLLTKGFLLDKIDNEEIIKITEKYWR